MTDALAPLALFTDSRLPPGVAPVLERLQRTAEVARVAVMPDVHVAGEFCVGTVVASATHLFPHAVGGDIGCGMLALQFDAAVDCLDDADRAARTLGALQTLCPQRRHHRHTAHPLPGDLLDTPLSQPQLTAALRSADARTQLGTLGAGNHFLELQRDEQDRLWLMIHTGSRHFGQLVHAHHLARARALSTGLLAIPADSPTGAEYLQDLSVARRYAAENRRLLAFAAARALEQSLHITPLLDTLLNIDHNHLALEAHDGAPLFVHRKGATPAHENQPGLIPGSMATASFHTRGTGRAPALCSSSHGAGRALSRTQARQKITPSALRSQLAAAHVWYDPRLTRDLLEEAPAAYKNIHDVMHAQQSLTTITRTLHPLLLHK